MKGFNYKKATQALNHLAQLNGGSLNKMKAIKLIWMADRLHLRKYGRTITGDQYFAMKHGPVASATRDILEEKMNNEYATQFIGQVDKNHFKSVDKPNYKVFSKTDLEALNTVFEKYGNLYKYDLRDFSHKFPEWQKFEEDLMNDVIRRADMDINDFFINVEDESGLFQDSEDFIQTSKEIFEEMRKMQSLISN